MEKRPSELSVNVSKQRQRLSQEIKSLLQTAYSLERSPFSFSPSSPENLKKAEQCRAYAEAKKKELSSLKSGTYSQRLAGFGHGRQGSL